MANSDWKTPFLRFRDELRKHLEIGMPIYHSILMSPFYTKDEISEVIENVAAADDRQPRAAIVEMPAYDCKYHAQFFHGSKEICIRLTQTLSRIEHWLIDVPKGLLPRFQLTYPRNAACSDLATWANIVYYLAWEIDAPYLQANVEYIGLLDEVTSFPWSDGKWPESCDPRPALIRQGDTGDYVSDFLKTYTDETKRWCPDIIGAFLPGERTMCGDFILASVAAVDILVFMLDQVRGPKSKNPGLVKRPARKRSRSRTIKDDVFLLKSLLVERHNVAKYGEKAKKPLTEKQLAIALEWFSESGEPLTSRVNRRMKEIYGPSGMTKYRSLFKGKLRRGLATQNPDGSTTIDAVYEDDEISDESETE